MSDVFNFDEVLAGAKEIGEVLDRLTATYGATSACTAMLGTAADFLAFADNTNGSREQINAFLDVYDKLLAAYRPEKKK